MLHAHCSTCYSGGVTRREDLVARATDYALEHGLVGLSLRPLAAALGTSDRMLLYHLGSKDELLVAIITESTDRSVAEMRALPRVRLPRPGGPRPVAAVDRRAAAALRAALRRGLHPRAVRRGTVRRGGRGEQRAVDGGGARPPRRVGGPPHRVGAVAPLVDAAFMGFELDLPLDEAEAAAGVEALAEAVELLSDR